MRAFTSLLTHPPLSSLRSLPLSSLPISYPSSSPNRWSCSLYDHRRIANRKLWKTKEDDDADYFIFPNERLGLTYSLNWALNRLSITPQGDAYRNLFPRGLQYLSKAPVDQNYATIVNSEREKVNTFELGKGILDLEDFREIYRKMRISFSNIENIYVNDGIFSSSLTSALTTRVVSDSPEVSLAFHHILPRVSLGDPFDWVHQTTVYICRQLQFSAELEKKVGLGPIAIVDKEKGNILFHNVNDVTAMQDVIADVCGHKISSSSPTDLLRCDAVSRESNVALLFDDAECDSGYGIPPHLLFGARHIIMRNDHITSLWCGMHTASTLHPTQRGDLLTRSASSTLRTTTLRPTGNTTTQPNMVILLSPTKGPKVVNMKNTEMMKIIKEKFLVSGSGENVEEVMKNAECFVVSVGGCTEDVVSSLLENPSEVCLVFV
jgi:hypothetical protein